MSQALTSETETSTTDEVTSLVTGVVDQGTEDLTTDTQEEEEVATAPTVTEKQVSTSTEFEQLIAGLENTGTEAQKQLIYSFKRYIAAMAPGVPTDGPVSVRHQYMLWKTISSVIENSPAEEFKKLWNIILAYFNTYKDGVFHERYILRFSEYWHYNIDELNAFQRIINVIKLTADPETRLKSLREVSLSRSLAEGFSEAGRTRLLGFYQ